MKGTVIYSDPTAAKAARRLRIAGTSFGLTFVVMGFLFFMANSLQEILFFFGSSAFVIGVVFLLESHAIRDFRIYERGIRLAGHGIRDIFQKEFLPFQRISLVEVSQSTFTMTVFYLDNKEKAKSVTVWRQDVERALPEICEIVSRSVKLIEVP